jgi:hypothetical protein
MGPVVVVRTAQRQVQLVVGDPNGFTELLDRRLRLLAQPGWSHSCRPDGLSQPAESGK